MSDSVNSILFETDVADTYAIRITLHSPDCGGKRPECYILRILLCKMIYAEHFPQILKLVLDF